MPKDSTILLKSFTSKICDATRKVTPAGDSLSSKDSALNYFLDESFKKNAVSLFSALNDHTKNNI